MRPLSPASALRREERHATRCRCRARALKEAAEELLALQPPSDRSSPAEGSWASPTIRALSPLELGLMYAWMASDEAELAGGATRWWTSAGASLQQRYEEAAGWVDEVLDGEVWVGGTKRPDATAAADEPAATLASGVASLDGLTGPGAAPLSLGRPTSHFIGAFVDGEVSPVGFAATRSTRSSFGPIDHRAEAARAARSKGGLSRDDSAEEGWVVDVLGVRHCWRGRGVGSVLARHCMEAAAAEGGAGRMYTIDVVPGALGFWAKLGFEEVAATGEQAELIPRGGDRPMAKLL